MAVTVGEGVGDGCTVVFVPTVAFAPELPFICALAVAPVGVGVAWTLFVPPAVAAIPVLPLTCVELAD